MRIWGHTAAAIAASLERQLQAGTRGTGAALPTVRHLAATLHVSPATVAAAYKLLRARGLVTGQGRRGTRVTPRAAPSPIAAPASPRDGLIDLSTGNPDAALLPPLADALRALEGELHLYGESIDRSRLRSYAAGEFEADGVAARAVAVCSGAMDAIERVLREHLRAGDRVAVEDPSFPGLLDLLSAAGYVTAPFALDQEGPLPEAIDAALARRCAALVMTPRAQNPTGAAVTPGRAAELARVLKRYPDVVLVENDYAGPVSGVPMHTLTTGSRRPWVVVRSTSKFLGPDLRVAVIAGDDLTIGRVTARQALGPRWVSHLLQELALRLWSDPASGRRLARAAEIYAQRRAGALEAMRATGIAAAASSSGFNVWVPVREEAHVVRELARRGWAVAAGERFRIQAGPGIRITTSSLQPPDAARFAADLAAALRPSSPGT